MDTSVVSRVYLETLSTADLIALADEYGIDIPENLNRRFIIGELLEAAEEINDSNSEEMQEVDEIPSSFTLPLSYNETVINVLLRNPVWCYVYWDIRNAEKEALAKSSSFSSIVLKISFFSEEDNVKPIESFDISVSLSDRDQYVLLPITEHSFRIDLYAEFKNQPPKCLAKSRTVLISKDCPEISSELLDEHSSEIMKLSGYPELIRSHFLNHRQSFS